MAAGLRTRIEAALKGCSRPDFATGARALLHTLGYHSERTVELDDSTPGAFLELLENMGRSDAFNAARARVEDWRSVDVLFQLSDAELGAGEQYGFGLDAWEPGLYGSFLFMAIDLKDDHYTRTDLSEITRAVNRPFGMPVPILFRHGGKLTLAVILRRQHKRDADKDVLEKVTLIKEIALDQPHTGHVHILEDLALEHLAESFDVSSFDGLLTAWSKTLDSSELNKTFYKELANWYFWAQTLVTFPQGGGEDVASRNATALIRLITRLIFVWFLKEKGLVPDVLFNERRLASILTGLADSSSSYYKAIVQNLFFATLNTEMHDLKAPRRFRGKNDRGGQDGHRLVHNVYRYADLFRDPDAALKLFAEIPFLNGGLFECLDREITAEDLQREPGLAARATREGNGLVLRVDGFSERPENPLTVPNRLFFCEQCDVDLNDTYGTKNRRYKVRGLIDLFDRYKFTVEENTPVEEEVALDPELLGKVFENLLAAYNPETGVTARKQTGSFYTPRAIVDYMVDESLIAYLAGNLTPRPGDLTPRPPSLPGKGEDVEARVRALLAYSTEPHDFSEAETAALIRAIDEIKILDPACGSGAFPMGALHKLVYALRRLDPDNARWRERQRARAMADTEEAYRIGEQKERQDRLLEIEAVFDQNQSDYGRKLYLIENCIYGVDIQPIAVQIAKLRCFIALIVEQRTDEARPNRGVRALPNLETQFVAANTLIGIPKPEQTGFKNPEIERREEELRKVRDAIFRARTPATKEKWRAEDRKLREEIAALLQVDGWKPGAATMLAAWNPYDQNASSPFFDPDWMFGVRDGFDVVIENPPYGANISEEHKDYLKKRHKDIVERIRNSYLYFMGESYRLAKDRGVVCLILPNEFLFQIYMTKARRFFLENARFLFAINLGEDVFDAIVPTCVIALVKEPTKRYDIPVADIRHCTLPELPELLKTEGLTLSSNQAILIAPNVMFSFDLSASQLVNRLATEFQPFETYCDDVANGISTSCDQVYIVSDSVVEREGFELEYLHECIRGGQFSRYYCPAHTDEYVLYITDSFQPKVGKNIYHYLEQHKALLIKKSVEKKTGKRAWHLLFRSRYEELFSRPKILLRQTGDRIVACADDVRGYYAIDSVNVAQVQTKYQEDILFFLALLNSRLVNFFYQQISQEAGRVLAQVKPQRIRALPIAYGDRNRRQAIETAAQQISSAKSQNLAANVSNLEREIDERVYALYGLTPEEIAVVEGAADRSG